MHIRLTRAPGRLAALVVAGVATGGLLSLAATAPALADTEPSVHVTSVSGVTVSAFHVTTVGLGGQSHGYPGMGGYGGSEDHGGGYGGDDHGGYGEHDHGGYGGWGGYGDRDHYNRYQFHFRHHRW